MGCGASGEEKYEVPQQDGLGGLYEARGHDSASPRRKAPYAFGTAICSSDEELMDALERHPRKLAVPYGCRQVTALGMERFAKEAKRLQKNKELSMDLEIVAYFCGWTDDHLAPLGRVCLAALDIGANPRISPGAILRFGAVSAELPRPITAAEGPRPIIHFGECSWPEEVLVALEVFDAYNQTSDALDRDLRMGIEEFEQWAADVKRSDFNWTQLCASVRCDPEAGLNVEQLIQIFRAGHMPVERPVGRTGRVKRGRAGREGHLREPSVEAVELLGQSNLPMPPGCMIDHGAYGLCLMRGALPPPRYGPRHYVVDCGQVGQHTLELQVIQERFRGRFSGQEGDPRQQQWSVARVPAASWSTKATELSLLEELVGAIGGTYTSQAEDSDDEEDNAALVTVSLAGCGVRDVTAAALSAALPGCPPRRALSLTVRDSGDLGRNSGLTDGGFTAIATGCGQCEGLTGLSLGYNRNVGALGCKALAAALPKCGELQFLCLNGNHEIGDEGAAALSYALSVCPKLIVLELMGCGLRDEGAGALAKYLPSCFMQGEIEADQRRGAMLDLRLNPFTNAGVGKLHRAWHNRSLGYRVPPLCIQLDSDCADRPTEGDELPYELDDVMHGGSPMGSPAKVATTPSRVMGEIASP